MTAPRLTRRLVLEAPERVPDGAGGFASGWRALGTIWAAIDMRSGREAGGQGAALSVVSIRITVRSAPVGAPERPLPDQRFREERRIYSILAVREEDPEGRYLTCEARKEIVA